MLGITVQSLKSVTGNQSKLLGSVIFSNVKNVELFLKKCRTCFCRGAAVARTGAAEVEIAFLLVLEFLVLHDAILWHEDASPNTRCQLRCCANELSKQCPRSTARTEGQRKSNPVSATELQHFAVAHCSPFALAEKSSVAGIQTFPRGCPKRLLP